MRKFIAIVKREYKKIVLTWAFGLSTLIGPLFLLGISLVPMLLFSIKGNAVRLAIVDDSGAISVRLRENLSAERQLEKFKQATAESFKNIDATQEEKLNTSAQQMGGNFAFEDYQTEGKPIETVRRELTQRIQQDSLDAYLIVPHDFNVAEAKFEFYTRNSSDFITNEVLKSAIEDSVRTERLVKANISEAQLKKINQKVDFIISKVSEKGVEKDSGFGFGVAFALGLIIYMSLTLYGSVIMGAIIEEKETRIAEILFSSAKPFELMMGKLVGVGFASLTQLVIWGISALLVVGYLLTMASASGLPFAIPTITPLFVLCFFVFFLLGFFIYATIYAILGAMVTTSQEGQQFAFPPILILLGGLYAIFPVIRDPNSAFSVWASITPFISPLVMPVRILLDPPPVEQILLSILINLAMIIGLTWVAGKVYRVGMLMYGKRATIPEVWKWIRQS